MEHKNKFYLINVNFAGFLENHKIVFDMPPFCSGNYEAIIHKDDNGLYIKKSEAYFDGCRDFSVVEYK